MTGTPTLLLVGGLTKHLTAAEKLGIRVVLLQHPDKLEPEHRELADHVEVVDYTDWAQVSAIVERHYDRWSPDAVLTLTEPGVENAARLNDRYGLGGTTYATARLLRDKAALRSHLAAHDSQAVPAQPLRERADLDTFGRRYGYPLVVKPTGATAGFGVLRSDGPGDNDSVWDQATAMTGGRTDRGTTLFRITGFLIEQYVQGPEFSVESFSAGGRHVVVAVTEKYVDDSSFTELAHALPARLDPAAEDRIRDRVTGFLDLVGLSDGPAHTELRLGPDGPAIIESHARAAGGAIIDLVDAAYGVDLVEMAIGRPFGLDRRLPDRPVPLRAASTRFLVGRPGTVEAVTGVEQARADERVLQIKLNVEPGDPVRPLRDNWDRLGLVAVTGPDTAAALDYGARVIEETVRISIRHPDGTISAARAAPATPPANRG